MLRHLVSLLVTLCLLATSAAADGHEEPNMVADLSGGKRLSYHLEQLRDHPENNVAHADIDGDTWDFVVIQGYSTEATVKKGDPDTFRRNALRLFHDVRDHPSGRGQGVAAVLYETWARGPGHAMYDETYDTPQQMQDEINASYHAAYRDFVEADGVESVRLAPVGEAYASLGFERKLYAGDIYHQGNDGGLLNSMVLYRTIYGEDVGDIAYGKVHRWARVDRETWEKLAAAADAMTVGVPVVDTPEPAEPSTPVR